MKFVKRSLIPEPTSLKGPSADVADERQRAVDHYASAPVPRTSFKFRAYKADDVVAALQQLFNNKCAYCESRVAATQPIDVEHYRPKAGVAEDRSHTGYWWLALEWTNLLPSCIDCNRRRKQYLIELGADGRLTRSAKQPAGKKDAFPIRGQIRARLPGDDLTAEDPLLIDPTVHSPDAHLQWNLDVPALPVVVARSTPNGPDPLGHTSVKVYGLNREGLVEARRSVLSNFAVEFELLRMLFGSIASMPPGQERASRLVDANERLTNFRRHGHSTQPYSAMAEVFVRQAEESLQREFSEALADTAPREGANVTTVVG